ncbi:serine/threonine protein kinase [Brasilonema sp. UFV-L1]
MVQKEPSFANNGKLSEPINKIAQEEIQQVLEQSLQNQRGIVSNWSHGYKLEGGRYILQEELSRGGFGVIYRAKDTRKNQDVVIKVLKNELHNQQEFDCFEENFVKEAIYLAICKHSCIVQFKNLIKSSGKWCIVMEYVEGEDLNKWVIKNGPLSENDALRYIRQIGEALKVLHDHNLLHRDVKPQNIIRRANGLEAVLIDLGIARHFSHNQTEQHTPIFTRDFAPIEQYIEKYKRGAYTDVYALAATLYFLLTGKVPITFWRRLKGETLETPQQIRGKQYISTQVNDAILLGLQIYPKERPQTIQEWLDRLPGKIGNIEPNLETQFSLVNTQNTQLNPTHNPLENVVSEAIQPPVDTLLSQANQRKFLNLIIAWFTSSASFLVTFAIVMLLKVGLTSASFWLLPIIFSALIYFFVTKIRKNKQQISLVISSLIPTLIIFSCVPGLENWKPQVVGFLSLVLLSVLSSLLGVAVMNLFQVFQD